MQQITFHKHVIASSLGSRSFAFSLGSSFTSVGAMTCHGRFAQSSTVRRNGRVRVAATVSGPSRPFLHSRVGMNQGQVLPSLKSCSALLNQSVTVRTLCASCRTGHVHP